MFIFVETIKQNDMKIEIAKVDPSNFGLETSKANELTHGLRTVLAERELLIKEFEVISKLELTKENLHKFKELRLKFVKNRTQGVWKWHKTNKEYFLTGGKFIDAIKNKESLVNETMEEKLMGAENHFDNLEKERLENIQKERVSLIEKFVDEIDYRDFSLMENDVWNAYFEAKKKAFEDKIAAEKKAEEERLYKIKEEKEERERIEKENAKLLKEAKEREILAEREANKRIKDESERKAKAEAEEKKRALEAAKLREENEAKLKAEREAKEHIQKQLKAKAEAEEKKRALEAAKLREENEAKLKAEREAKEHIQKQLKAKAEAEEKAKLEEEARLQSELNKGDADKVHDLLIDLNDLKTKYNFKSDKNKKIYSDVGLLIDKVTSYINK